MKTVQVLQPFEAEVKGKRVAFATGAVADFPADHADALIGAGLAKEATKAAAKKAGEAPVAADARDVVAARVAEQQPQDEEPAKGK